MSDDKFGDKLHDVEKAREDQWAREEDKRLLERMRQKAATPTCPQCHTLLVSRQEGAFTIMACQDGHGAWLDHDALQGLIHAR
ncbi:MAG TPA: zf-TFIIB domain-containing protein [Candidatus Binataceae bacterium]|nr:zf-TFIIB domain-containing protein [Candidatus Binataceae bacterium]